MNDKWSRIAGDENVYSTSPRSRIVCKKPHKSLGFKTKAQNNAQWEADARLIAAAPQLLNALGQLYDEYEDRRAQFGSDYIWKKYEDVEAIEEARRLLDELKGE